MIVNLFFISMLMVIYPIALYPFMLFVISRFFKQFPARYTSPSHQPRVSIITVVRNGQDNIQSKLENLTALDYPGENLEIIVASDGSNDDTIRRIESFRDRGVKILESRDHVGKITMLNRAAQQASGEILVFTDLMAMLPSHTLQQMVRWFQDSSVGGVSGRKTILCTHKGIETEQARYFGYEDLLRNLEGRVANPAANDGFLYAMRKSLFTPIPPSVTDDLYNAMGTIRQKKRFIFDPEVIVHIPVRAKSWKQEIARRRRIVCRSLNGLWHMRVLFNCFRYGWFSWILFSHKILRRMIPFFMLLFLVSNAVLTYQDLRWGILLLLQFLCYFMVVLYFNSQGLGNRRKGFPLRILNAWSYFCIGNLGTLIGTGEFLFGKRYDKWDSVLK